MTRHGKSDSREYCSWHSMMDRCRNPNRNSYPNYGGRGVRVCERWHDFANFFRDMGPRPQGTSIDRINVDGDYEPGNCRWATQLEQASNRRPVVHPSRPKDTATLNGVTKTLDEWANGIGITADGIRYRLKAGWTTESALTTLGNSKSPKSTCNYGHRLDGEHAGGRYCKTCARQKAKAHYYRKKAEVMAAC